MCTLINTFHAVDGFWRPGPHFRVWGPLRGSGEEGKAKKWPEAKKRVSLKKWVRFRRAPPTKTCVSLPRRGAGAQPPPTSGGGKLISGPLKGLWMQNFQCLWLWCKSSYWPLNAPVPLGNLLKRLPPGGHQMNNFRSKWPKFQVFWHKMRPLKLWLLWRQTGFILYLINLVPEKLPVKFSGPTTTLG